MRNRIALDKGVSDPATVPQEDIDKIFTLAHLEHPSGTEIYLHAKHMIVDDIWMVIGSSNFSRRGMTYETEIGVTITDAEVEDGVRKIVRDHRIRLWAEHLRLDRSHWHRLLDPIAGAELLRQAMENPNLPLIPFEINNTISNSAIRPRTTRTITNWSIASWQIQMARLTRILKTSKPHS